MNGMLTSRLKFRDINKHDLQNIIDLYGCPITMKHISGGVALTENECEEKLNKFIADKETSHPYGIWAAELKDTGEFVGWFLLKLFPNIEDPGVGYSLHKKFWGNGYATEGTAAVIDYGFNKVSLLKMSAITDPDNFPSIKVLLKLGFRFEKLFQYHNPLRAQGVPTNLYTLTK